MHKSDQKCLAMQEPSTHAIRRARNEWQSLSSLHVSTGEIDTLYRKHVPEMMSERTPKQRTLADAPEDDSTNCSRLLGRARMPVTWRFVRLIVSLETGPISRHYWLPRLSIERFAIHVMRRVSRSFAIKASARRWNRPHNGALSSLGYD